MAEDPSLRVAGGAGARSVCVVWRLRGRGGRGSPVLLVYGDFLFALCAFLLWMAEPSHARSGGVVAVCALGFRRDFQCCCCCFLWATVLRVVPSVFSRVLHFVWVMCSAPQ
ncbi:hypothetical protein TcCL_Unassigned01640 [Trypanosoma cruzi]|nr:hypothetical protein TcCL_Unassigned01640 [Trypanosoma cruzi]